MAKHIGIVGCSAPGAALCFETICREAAAILGGCAHPEITMHTLNFQEQVNAIERDDWRTVGELLAASARKLASIGADFAICPDNTSHQGLPFIESDPLPWLHIADAVLAEAKALGVRRLGVLGTRYLMEGPVYAERLDDAGVAWSIPDRAERNELNRIIFEELVLGRVVRDSQRKILAMIDQLRNESNCDAVVLGCTELPLAVAPEEASLPTLDSTRLLARAAVRRALDWSARLTDALV